MCTAHQNFLDPSHYSQSKSTSTRTSRRAVLGMKLPRYNATSSTAGAALRANEESPTSRRRHQVQDGGEMTPRASGRQGRLVSAAPADDRAASAASGHVRRCQSANAAANRPRSAVPVDGRAVHKSRSHSRDPVSGYHRREVTRELPIPPSQRGGHGPSLGRSVDKGDLTRMYDYATWNMYERIVSARRRRLSALDAEEQSPKSSPGAAKAATASATASPAAAEAAKTSAQLHKAPSHDEQSTLATADETDKSSTTSSSWSRSGAYSPAAYPGMNVVAFPHPHQPREVHSCPPPGYEHQASSGLSGEDDSFIFELDM